MSYSIGLKIERFEVLSTSLVRTLKCGLILASIAMSYLAGIERYHDIRDFSKYAVRIRTERTTGTQIPATRDQGVRARMQRFEASIHRASDRYQVPAALIAGLIQQESQFNPNARSHVGAMGLMQLMPATARGLGVTNAFDPEQNIDAGTRYLKTLIDQFDGNIEHALAAYNAGPGSVRRHGGIPPIKETQRYVPKVLNHAFAFMNSQS